MNNYNKVPIYLNAIQSNTFNWLKDCRNHNFEIFTRGPEYFQILTFRHHFSTTVDDKLRRGAKHLKSDSAHYEDIVGTLLGDANDATGSSSSSIPSGLAELMTTLAKIIDISMHHHGATNDGVLSCQGDHGVGDVNLGGSTSGLNIAKVTNMSLFILRTSMFLLNIKDR